MSGEAGDSVSEGRSVSRETLTPPVPEVARGVFDVESLSLAERYVEWLATEGVVRGLIGPREPARLWERHVVNCALLAPEIADGATVCDIGSGAGLPGIVLAILRRDLTITLCEPLLRRTTFLNEVVADLGLSNVNVVRARADALHGVERFDVVTSRAVAPLPRLLDWSMPLVAPTGALLALKGAAAADEVAKATSELADWGCGVVEVLVLRAAGLDSPTYAVRVPWSDPSSVSWPPAGSGDSRGLRSSGPPPKRGRQHGR